MFKKQKRATRALPNSDKGCAAMLNLIQRSQSYSKCKKGWKMVWCVLYN